MDDLSLNIINQAHSQVEDLLKKAEQTLTLLQQNLQQVTSQRIALAAQKALLEELKTKILHETSKKDVSAADKNKTEETTLPVITFTNEQSGNQQS